MIKSLSPRSKPIQNRARLQREKILKVTSQLLKTVGLDELTTILVAKKVGVSVGTLYHYFPNKHAILYALSELWVESISNLTSEIESQNLNEMQLKPFINLLVDRIAGFYKDNSSLLPLVAVMGSMPELEKINSDYLSHIHSKFASILKALPLSLTDDDVDHMSVFYWQICHSLLASVYCGHLDETKSLADLKYILMSLLDRARTNF
ncbi:MAG: TetR/AcrR family transcriptional regulator [Porticoccaceae bacterium]